jgi:hypothetical protein
MHACIWIIEYFLRNVFKKVNTPTYTWIIVVVETYIYTNPMQTCLPAAFERQYNSLLTLVGQYA